MTLQEAIDHCYEVANGKNNQCQDCKNEHLQLAEWLEELKELQKLHGYVMFADGHKEPIEYIAKHDENHIRVFTKSGEYLAHKNFYHIFFHDIFYSFDLTWGEDTISDRSRWVVSNDAVKIVIKR